MEKTTRAAGWSAFRAICFGYVFPGLKPWAILCSRFGRLRRAILFSPFGSMQSPDSRALQTSNARPRNAHPSGRSPRTFAQRTRSTDSTVIRYRAKKIKFLPMDVQ